MGFIMRIRLPGLDGVDISVVNLLAHEVDCKRLKGSMNQPYFRSELLRVIVASSGTFSGTILIEETRNLLSGEALSEVGCPACGDYRKPLDFSQKGNILPIKITYYIK